MTPSRWLFFPTQATGGANVTFTGNLAVDTTSSNSSSNINNWSVAGPDASDFDEYASTPYRRTTPATYIEWMFRVDTTATYSDAAAFIAAITPNSSGSSITVGSTTLAHTSVTLLSVSTIVRWRFNCSSVDGLAFWEGGASNDLLTVSLAWT